MRPWSWAAAWMLMLQLQLGAFLLRASAVDALDSAPATLPTLESTYNITALPESCSFVRKDFGFPIFDYQASWASNATVPSYCTLEISYMFLDGADRAFSQTHGVQLKDCGIKAGSNNASCEAALRCGRASVWDGSPQWWSTVRPNAPGATVFDEGELCGDAPSIGYFYIHNSCNLTFGFALKVTTQPRSSCHLAARIAAMAWKALMLFLRGIGTILTWFAYLWVGAAALALVSLIVIYLVYALVLIAKWAFKWICACFEWICSRFRRPPLPPVVEMAAPVKAGEAAAKECNLLLGGGAHVPRPSGLPAEQQ